MSLNNILLISGNIDILITWLTLPVPPKL